jgi:ankyrin repeat protein
VNVETSSGRTPLVEACRNGHLHVARLLVQYGVVVEHVPRHRKTAFDHADWAGHQVTHTHSISGKTERVSVYRKNGMGDSDKLHESRNKFGTAGSQDSGVTSYFAVAGQRLSFLIRLCVGGV